MVLFVRVARFYRQIAGITDRGPARVGSMQNLHDVPRYLVSTSI